jgi:hypothetical protein
METSQGRNRKCKGPGAGGQNPWGELCSWEGGRQSRQEPQGGEARQVEQRWSRASHSAVWLCRRLVQPPGECMMVRRLHLGFHIVSGQPWEGRCNAQKANNEINGRSGRQGVA